MAHTLVEIWIRREGNVMTLDGFHAAGGVAGAISQTAEAIFEHRFDPVEREATKRLFLGKVKVWDEFSVDRACEIGKLAFDTVRRYQYLGQGEPSLACD